MRCADKWGVPLYVAKQVSLDEFRWWKAYFAFEPWGRNQESVQLAVCTAAIISAFTGQKTDPGRFLKEPPPDSSVKGIADADLFRSMHNIRPKQPHREPWEESE